MKYYKQWSLTETLISVIGNLRKEYSDKYILRADYNQILFWTNTPEPELKAILYVEATHSASQAALDELMPNDGVRRFRVAGSFIDMADRMKKLFY
jgi:hypothetical protein